MNQITFYLIISILFSALSFGQTPIIRMIAHGDCSEGIPKVLEVYAN